MHACLLPPHINLTSLFVYFHQYVQQFKANIKSRIVILFQNFGDGLQCEYACLLQILHDTMRSDIDVLENVTNIIDSGEVKDYFEAVSYSNGLQKAIALTKELSTTCATTTEIDSECSFKPSSKMPLRPLLYTAAEMIVIARDAHLNLDHFDWFE